MKVCHVCGNIVPFGQLKCPFCGNQIKIDKKSVLIKDYTKESFQTLMNDPDKMKEINKQNILLVIIVFIIFLILI